MKNSSESHKEIRPISYSELHLMMTRLMFDVLENPFDYNSHRYNQDKDLKLEKNMITNFIIGEDCRRNLFLPVRKVLIEKV